MHAIIVTGGKQYRVTAGSIIEVEKLEGNVGDIVKIDQVLGLSGDKNILGSPLISGALVEAQILEQGKADKVLIFKKKRRHNYRRKNGHRQRFTALHILSIGLNGTSLVTAEKRTPKPRATTPQKEGAVVAKTSTKASAPKAKAGVKPAAKKPVAAKKPAAKKAAK